MRLGFVFGILPAARIEPHQPRGLDRRAERFLAIEAGLARIAAGGAGNIKGSGPAIFQRSGMDAEHGLRWRHRMAAQPVECAKGRFEGPVAAIARRALDRTTHLAAGARRNEACAHRCRGAARRAAGRAGQIEGIAGRARIGGAELGGDGLGENRRAAIAQRTGMGAVLIAAIASHCWTVELGRHALDLVKVLDRHRHAIDHRQRAVLPVACGRFIRRLAGDSDGSGDKGFYIGLARRDQLQPTLQIGARRIAAIEEAGNGIEPRHQPGCLWIVMSGR